MEGVEFLDPAWRLHNLYWITNKAGEAVKFCPNGDQLRFLDDLHYRNVILKARQRGFSTLIQLIMLDAAVFNSHIRAGVIAQSRPDVETIFRDKIKFAYDRLPDAIKAERFPLSDSSTELLLSNNSSVRVGTSMRSGTLQYLHVSEMGKIAAKFPERAREVITGAIPAVAPDGFSFVESTAEGSTGAFFDMCQAAQKRMGRPLLPQEEKFHFYSWFTAPEYEVDPLRVPISDEEHQYFNRLEGALGIRINERKRAWYVLTKQTLQDDMLREYPSTPEEAFAQSVEGAYYANEMARVRGQGRICRIPVLPVPVNTFWDIGNSDGCAIWLQQQVGAEDRFIGYYEAHGESLEHYVAWLQSRGVVFGKHYLPHDADHKRLGGERNKSVRQMLGELGLRDTVIVPRISNINTGIQQTRKHFPTAWFDEAECKLGVSRLDNYRKRWNERDGRWFDEPMHDENSEGADAFRQFAQARECGLLPAVSLSGGAVKKDDWRSRMSRRGSAQAA